MIGIEINELGGYVFQLFFYGYLGENMRDEDSICCPVFEMFDWPFVSVLSFGHQNTNTSPNQTARRSGGVSLGCAARLQPPRGQCDHSLSGGERKKEKRGSLLLAGTEKIRKLTLKHWREQCVSVIPQQEQCVPNVYGSNAAPAPPSLRSLCGLSCSALMEVSRCRQEAAAAV